MSNEANGLRLVSDHIYRVQSHMRYAINKLMVRLCEHDQSKYTPAELPLVTGKAYLDSLVYNSEEYKAALLNVKEAVSAHYAKNPHHPECHPNGVAGMSLFDLLEMLCDWKAAGETSKDGSIEKSIALNTERFKLSPDLVAILTNTAQEMYWVE